MYHATISFKGIVTGSKFHHPEGKDHFNPYLENQSNIVARQLIKLLSVYPKSYRIEYERDFTNIIKTFTVTLEVLTNEIISNDDKVIINALLQARSDANPIKNRAIPYKLELFVPTCKPTEENPIDFPTHLNSNMNRNYFGTLLDATYTYVTLVKQNQQIPKSESAQFNAVTSASNYLSRNEAPETNNNANTSTTSKSSEDDGYTPSKYPQKVTFHY